MFDNSLHEVFLGKPDPGQELIRYMSLPKFLNLLVSSSLNFAAPSSLNDPWEGEISRVNKLLRSVIYKDLPLQALTHFEEVDKVAKDFCYVSCWHEFAQESYLMWKAYASEQGSLAIRTNWKSLTDSITDEQQVFGARINYVDRSQTFVPEGNLMWRHMHKGHQYKDEKEIRLVVTNNILDRGKQSESLAVKVDLNVLVTEVLMAPGTPTWLENLLEVFRKDYGLKAQIRRSTLDTDDKVAI